MEIVTIELVVGFVRSTEGITIEYFETIYPDYKIKTILYLINKAKKAISSSCRIADTFLTQTDIIGNLNENGDCLSKHIDKRRSCNCIISCW